MWNKYAVNFKMLIHESLQTSQSARKESFKVWFYFLLLFKNVKA